MPPGKTTLVVLALLAGSCGAVWGQDARLTCQAHTRASHPVPDIVRDWLARSGDDHVVACVVPAPDKVATGVSADVVPLYFGESAVARQGSVCSYSSHGLTPVGTGTKRQLRRYERGDALHLALAVRACPPPHSAIPAEYYTETYDVSADAFVSIMGLWAAAATAAPAFDAESCCDSRNAAAGAARGAVAATGPGKRLRAAIEAGRMKTASVTRIVRISGLSLRRRYALFVADPDSQPPGSTLYVIYLSRWLAGTYRITGVADAAD